MIRLWMVLRPPFVATFDDTGACEFLEKLQTEEYNLYATMAMLAHCRSKICRRIDSTCHQGGVIPPVPFYRVYTRKNSDAIMDSCRWVVGTEIMWMQRELDSRRDVEVVVVSESEILKKFSDVIPL